MRAKFKAWAGEEFTTRIEKLSHCLLYGVVIGLLPFAFPVMKATIIGPHMTLTLLFGRGDLFLVTATLVAASFGDLIAGGKERALGKIWVGFFCFVDFVLCLIWFGAVSDALDVHEKYDATLTGTISLVAFSLAMILCACALLLSARSCHWQSRCFTSRRKHRRRSSNSLIWISTLKKPSIPK